MRFLVLKHFLHDLIKDPLKRIIGKRPGIIASRIAQNLCFTVGITEVLSQGTLPESDLLYKLAAPIEQRSHLSVDHVNSTVVL